MSLLQGRSAIISVGDELLAGRVVDTNAAWLSGVLRLEGFPVAFRAIVQDDPDSIASAVRQALTEAQVVIVGGGIGPTKDDVTRDGVAKAVGVPLELHPGALELVRGCYAARSLRVPAGSEVQAMLPRGFEPVVNRVGSAPGFLRRIPFADHLIVVVPGVPGELRAMVEDSVVPLLRSHPGRGPAPLLGSVTVAGLREVDLGRRIEDLMERGRDPVVGSYPKLGRVVLTVESRAPADEAARRVETTLAEIERRIGDAVVGRGDLMLNEVVAAILLERKTTVAIAESLTGGLVADGLVAVPGISEVFLAGWVAYANRTKVQELGVPQQLLDSDGAVSEACVRAMAAGARARSGAAFALSVSGIAGPGGGSAQKPVGTVWFAISDAAGEATNRAVFPGDRSAVRAYACARAYDLMRRRLLGLPLVPAAPAAQS